MVLFALFMHLLLITCLVRLLYFACLTPHLGSNACWVWKMFFIHFYLLLEYTLVDAFAVICSENALMRMVLFALFMHLLLITCLVRLLYFACLTPHFGSNACGAWKMNSNVHVAYYLLVVLAWRPSFFALKFSSNACKVQKIFVMHLLLVICLVRLLYFACLTPHFGSNAYGVWKCIICAKCLLLAFCACLFPFLFAVYSLAQMHATQWILFYCGSGYVKPLRCLVFYKALWALSLGI